VKRVVPKLTVNNETPKKYFKSRVADMGSALSTPKLGAPAKATRSRSKAFKLDAILVGAGKTPALSAKENTPYNIYEDTSSFTSQAVEAGTPATSGVRKAARSSARKKPKEELAAPPSVCKTPRMASLAEGEVVLRAPSTRKAALKRLM
jgi:hypothetical protein